MPSFATYRLSIFLILSMITGGLTGMAMGSHAVILKPFGDIFLNLLYTIVVPLIFFIISSAVIQIGEWQRLRKIFLNMFSVFMFTGSIAAIFMIVVVVVFPPTLGVTLKLTQSVHTQSINVSEQLVNMLTVPNLTELFLPRNMLALVFISILIGFAVLIAGEKAKPFADFLQSGSEVFMKLISLLMYYAPIGFFAFSAVLVAQLGPELLASYFRAAWIYYGAGILYFFIGFTAFAFLANKKTGVKLFWTNSILPAMTALATCSSAASIPANLQAVSRMQVSRETSEAVIPLGTILHK